jgi:hypothetical protein
MLTINQTLAEIHEKSTVYRKGLSKLSQALHEWSLIEDLYSSGLSRIYLTISKSSEFSFTSKICNLFLELSDSSKKFAQDLRGAIFSPLDTFLVQQASSVKKVYADGIKAGEILIASYSDTVNSMKIYYDKIIASDKIALQMDREKSNSKKEKLLKELINAQKVQGKTLNDYQENLSIYNKNSEKYLKNLKKILTAYNFYATKASEQHSHILFLIQQSLSKRINQTLIKADFFQDKIEPCEYKIDQFQIPEITLEKYIGSHPEFNYSPTRCYSIFERSNIEDMTGLVEELYREAIEIIINKAWNGEELSDNDYSEFNTKMAEPVGRTAMCFCLNTRRNKSCFEIPEKGYETIATLLIPALTEAERSHDFNTIKIIIVLTQTFYMRSGQDKVYLYYGIQGHDMWKKMEFWERLINSTITEELKKQGENFEGTRDLAAVNNKSLVFCQLASFGNIMMMFRLDESLVRGMIEKYSNTYQFSKNETSEIMEAIIESASRNPSVFL